MRQSPDDRSLPAPLTDKLLRSWLRCRRKAWLDRHGPRELQRWNAHRSLALQEQLLRFQQLLPHKPSQGLQACQEGNPSVMGVRLRGPGPQGLEVEAHPTLLLRVNTPSRWGGHGYRPVLSRQGRRTTREHRLVLALWGRLLSEHQKAPVPHGLVLAGQGGRLVQERLTLTPALDGQVDDSLGRLAEDLQRPTPPALVNDRKKCTLCSWRQLCDQEAARDGHLSEVSGVGSKRRDLLMQVGIHSLRDLAEAEPSNLAAALEPHGDQHRDMALQLVAQAQVQATGQPQRLLAGDGLGELEQAPGVLIYDIESDPDTAEHFLHGFWILPKPAEGHWPEPAPFGSPPSPGRYRPLLALAEHGEQRLWERLQALFARYPAWPVLHYGETALQGRLVDVHLRLRQQWLLPVNSYGLKAVASWLGFRWSQPGADGARCLLRWRLWRQWYAPGVPPPSGGKEKGRRELERIFLYNRDDALATWAVAYWLLQAPGGSGSTEER